MGDMTQVTETIDFNENNDNGDKKSKCDVAV
jgi:hypothetical protein